MLRKIEDETLRKVVFEKRYYLVPEYFDFSESWIAQGGKIQLSAENIVHPISAEAEGLVNAFKRAIEPGEKLYAVLCDPGFTEAESTVFEVDGTVDDFWDLSIEFGAINYLMFPESLRCAVLFLYILDVKFLVGDQLFLENYGGAISEQAKRFRDFIYSQQKSIKYDHRYINNLRWAYEKTFPLLGFDDLKPYSEGS